MAHEVIDITDLMDTADAGRKARKAKSEQAAMQAVKEKPKAPPMTAKQRQRLENIEKVRSANVECPSWLKLVDNVLAMDAMVKDLEQNEFLCLDVETTSLDWTRAELVAVTYYSPASATSYFVPIGMKDGQYHNLSLGMVRDFVKALHANTAIKKLNHNIRYDAHILRVAGMPIAGIYFDTLIAANVMNENEESKALKDLARIYLGHDDALRFDELFDGRKFAEAPYPVAHIYAGKDPKLVWELFEFYMGYLNQAKYAGLKNVLFEIELPLIDLVIEMEANGFRMALDYVRDQAEKVQTILDGLRIDLVKRIAGPGLAWYGKQLKEERRAIRVLLRERGFTVDEPDQEGEAVLSPLTLEEIGAIAYDGLGHERGKIRKITKTGLKRLDDPIINAMLAYLDMQSEAAAINQAGQWDMNFGSPLQVATLLFDVLGLPEIDGRSTGEEVLKALSKKPGDAGKIAKALMDFREMEKTKTAFLDTIPEVMGADGLMHTSLNQYGTKTGRFTSSGIGKTKAEKMGLNLQQMPNALAKINVRAAFLPFLEGDWLLCGIDYSQIEPRYAAHQSQAKNWLDAYTTGRDIYKTTASELWSIGYDDVTTEQRKKVKAVALGIMYGLTEYGLADRLGMEVKDAKQFIEDFLDAVPELRADVARVHKECEQRGYVTTMAGRKRRLEEIWTPPVRVELEGGHVIYKEAPEKKRAKRQSYNATVQGSAQDIIKKAMGDIKRMRAANPERYTFYFVLQIHDEIILVIPKAWAEQREIEEKDPHTGEPVKVVKWFPVEGSPVLDIAEAMTLAVKLSVPFKVDIAISETWGGLD